MSDNHASYANLQLLLKDHIGKKTNNNWQRFSIDEQIQYIETAIKLQSLVAPKFDLDLEQQVLGSMLERFKEYQLMCLTQVID